MNTVLMIEQHKQYWSNELQLPLPGFHIYTDGSAHVTHREMKRTTMNLDVESAKMNRLRELYNFDAWMLTSYVVFLYRMTLDKDLLIGVNFKGANLLPIRIAISGTDTFKQVFEQIVIKLEKVEAAALPLDMIEHITGESLHILTIYGHDSSYEHSGMNWVVQEDADQWMLHVSYAQPLYTEETIRKFSKHFQQLIHAALEDMDMAICELSILTEEDWAAYAILNDTKKELPVDSTIVGMLDSVVGKFPSRIALSYEDEQVTYEQLDQLSNQIANMLISQGLSKGEFVSIFMDRGSNTVISLLGVIKAGGAYVPIDPAHPDERNAYIIADTKSAIILTQDDFQSKLNVLLANFDKKPQIICPVAQLGMYSKDACGIKIEPDDLAYVIYTSGSTGKPKGALIAHHGVVNLAIASQEDIQLTEEDYILQYSTFSFDASVYDLFPSLASGSRLHMLSDEQRFSIDAFTKVIQETNATRVGFLPTVFFNQLATHLPADSRDKYPNLKSVGVGGEALSGETVRLFRKKLQVPIVNVYGPTEITAVATTHIVDYSIPDDLSTVYIGTPLANYELYIVGDNNKLCPTCVTGELLISSVGVGKGYLNHPEKTKEVFISDPIVPLSGKKFYRSGDLVRLLPNGQVEYKGRIDSQVKIRGFRIEIGEIEDNLAKHDRVKDSAVIPVIEADGTKMLAAFYTSNDGQAVANSDLMQFLNKKVPSYMVPKYMCFVEEMPLSPTGKIDRKKLATFELSTENSSSNYEAPTTELQLEVSTAWSKALNLTKISIHDDFFEIGGYSLKILESLVLLKPRYPQLKINDFFVYPTIAKLSDRIEELAKEVGVSERIDDTELPFQDLVEFPRSFFSKDASQSRMSMQTNILLTGATGYLGSHLLFELLRQSEATVYCLVRPSQGIEPFKRVVQIMSGYFGEDVKKLMDKRVVAIQGDLEKANLGLSLADRVLIDEHMDSIIHCGADVKHFGESEHFAKVNVESTNRLLALAKSRPDIRFHFISTLGIPEDLALNGQWDSIVNGSSYEVGYVDNVYTNSKLEAEKLVVKAGEEGIPVTIYRVGNLACHSENGMFQKNIDNNAFYRMLKAMLLLKRAPKVRWEVDMTPINYAGEAITALALQQETVGRLFHICNPSSVHYEQMIGYFQSFGYEITLMDWNEYESWVLDPNNPKDQTGLELAMAQLEGDGAKNNIYRYACPQTLEYLSNSGVNCALPNEQFFNKLIDYAISIDYFNKPE